LVGWSVWLVWFGLAGWLVSWLFVVVGFFLFFVFCFFFLRSSWGELNLT
jgi:hypothetical protein